MRGMLRFGQERQLQLLSAQSLLLAGSNGVDHSDSRLVYRAGQVVCRPENHSYPYLRQLKGQARAGVFEITKGAPTLATGKRHDDPPGSRNHPINS
jgi:hypothetical protein